MVYTINNIKNSSHIKQYLNNIHPDLYKTKVPFNNSKSNFKKDYRSCIQYIPIKYIPMLKKYINIIYKKIKGVGLDHIIEEPFYILMSINDLESNISVQWNLSDLISFEQEHKKND